MLLIVFRPRLLNQLSNVAKVTPKILNGETLRFSDCGSANQVRPHVSTRIDSSSGKRLLEMEKTGHSLTGSTRTG
jgi:hypothetical protein